MWNDVTIGEGDRGCSAVVCFAIKGKHSISENRNCFWIDDLFLGLGMRIFKNTEEGKSLTEMIAAERPLQDILDWLNSVALKNIDPFVLMHKVEKEQVKYYKMGASDKASEIRSVLGIK